MAVTLPATRHIGGHITTSHAVTHVEHNVIHVKHSMLVVNDISLVIWETMEGQWVRPVVYGVRDHTAGVAIQSDAYLPLVLSRHTMQRSIR